MIGLKRRWLTLAVSGIALATSMPASLPVAAEADFAGEYAMSGKGFGPRDTAYLGTCSLSRDQQAYRVSCYNSDTRHTYTGRGVAAGDTLAVFIGDELKGDHNSLFTGEYLVLYRRQPDGSLAGTWLHAASPASGAETLTPKR